MKSTETGIKTLDIVHIPRFERFTWTEITLIESALKMQIGKGLDCFALPMLEEIRQAKALILEEWKGKML